MLRLQYAEMLFRYIYNNERMADTIKKRIEENNNALIGYYDGFCYDSRRADARFRTLGDMMKDGLLTEDEVGTIMRITAVE